MRCKISLARETKKIFINVDQLWLHFVYVRVRFFSKSICNKINIYENNLIILSSYTCIILYFNICIKFIPACLKYIMLHYKQYDRIRYKRNKSNASMIMNIVQQTKRKRNYLPCLNASSKVPGIIAFTNCASILWLRNEYIFAIQLLNYYY